MSEKAYEQLQLAKEHMASLIRGGGHIGAVEYNYGHLKDVDYTYLRNRLNSTAFYSCVWEDNWGYASNTACHAALGSSGFPVYYVVNSVDNYAKKGHQYEVAKVWYEELANNSTWAEVFVTKDVDEALETGCVMTAEVEGTLLGGACMHIRQPWEHNDICETFYHCKQLGFDTNISIIMAHAIGCDGRFITLREATGHVGLDSSILDPVSAINLLNGEVQQKRGIFTKEASYHGVNKSWVDGLKHDHRANLGWNDRLSDYSGLKNLYSTSRGADVKDEATYNPFLKAYEKVYNTSKTGYSKGIDHLESIYEGYQKILEEANE